MEYRIAIASSDGQKVNQHFGQAENFLIYEIKKGEAEFIEDRIVNFIKPQAYHSDAHIKYLTDLLSDCKVVFALKIGDSAAQYLIQNGLKTFPVNFSINHIVNSLLRLQNGRVKII